MEYLDWTQSEKGIHVYLNINNKPSTFTIPAKETTHLLAGTPRIYIVYIQSVDNSQTEKSYLLNLTELKPIITKNNALKISLGKSQNNTDKCNGLVAARYCIARGESYHDRFLEYNSGWKSQRIYNDLYFQNSENQILNTNNENNNLQSVNLKTNLQNQSKLTTCKHCKEIINSDTPICVYCKFDNRVEKEQNVDIII